MAKIINIKVWRGLVDKVSGVPKGWKYYIDDKDILEEKSAKEKRFRRRMYKSKK